MGRLLLFVLLLVTVLSSLVKPWIGVIAYYIHAILVPAALWPWVFRGTRVSFYVAAGGAIGFLIATLRGRVDFRVLRGRQNFYVFALWIALTCSYYFGAFGINESFKGIDDSTVLYTMMCKIFLFYVVAILVIDERWKFHLLILVMVGSGAFFACWGNIQYFSGEMARLGTLGLTGPGFGGISSIYTDENCFATFFVMSIPFLYFMGEYYRNKLIKWFLWLLMPLGWHAIFLTGSRGGLLGLGTVTIFVMLRSKYRLVSLAIPVAFIAAFVLQAGDYMKNKSEKIVNVEGEGSAQGRLQAWEAAIKMAIDHPITGVGVGNFMRAFPVYSDKAVRVTHNSVFQLLSESGGFAALAYVLIFWRFFVDFFRSRKWIAESQDAFFRATSNSIMGSAAGFFVCAMFLNLATYEVFYFVVGLNGIQRRLLVSEVENDEASRQ